MREFWWGGPEDTIVLFITTGVNLMSRRPIYHIPNCARVQPKRKAETSDYIAAIALRSNGKTLK